MHLYVLLYLRGHECQEYMDLANQYKFTIFCFTYFTVVYLSMPNLYLLQQVQQSNY